MKRESSLDQGLVWLRKDTKRPSKGTSNELNSDNHKCWFVGGTHLNPLHEWAHSVLTTSLWNRYYYFPYVTDKETGTVRLRCLPKVSCEARVLTESLTSEPMLLSTRFLSTKCTVCIEVLREAKAGAVLFNWGQTFWIGEQKLVCLLVYVLGFLFSLRSGRT